MDCTVHLGVSDSLIPLWRLLFSHIQFRHLSLPFLIALSAARVHISHLDLVTFPPSLPISPFLLLPSVLPRATLPVFFSAHCPASPAPVPTSCSSSSSPPIVICFGSQRLFFYKITSLFFRGIIACRLHVMVVKCCQLVLAEWSSALQLSGRCQHIVAPDDCEIIGHLRNKSVSVYLSSPLFSKHTQT